MTKKFIKAIIIFIVILILIFAYGFFIGGQTGLLFYMFIGIPLLLMLFLFYKKLFSKDYAIIIVLIMSVVMILSSEFYLLINNSFDETPVESYESEIYYYDGRKTIFDEGYYFKNPQGNECFRRSSFDYYSEDYDYGDKVIVYRYSGLFGVEHYKFEKQQ